MGKERYRICDFQINKLFKRYAYGEIKKGDNKRNRRSLQEQPVPSFEKNHHSGKATVNRVPDK
jgi:hypothetical protein